MNRLIYSVLGLSAALVCAMPAMAREDASIHVSYADLNLSTRAGSATFARRIDAAITEICGTSDGQSLHLTTMITACQERVGGNAHAQMNKVIAAAQSPQTTASAKMATLASR